MCVSDALFVGGGDGMDHAHGKRPPTQVFRARFIVPNSFLPAVADVIHHLDISCWEAATTTVP